MNDKVNTANKIVLASGLPLSLTIIGIGAADFSTVSVASVCVSMCVL